MRHLGLNSCRGNLCAQSGQCLIGEGRDCLALSLFHPVFVQRGLLNITRKTILRRMESMPTEVPQSFCPMTSTKGYEPHPLSAKITYFLIEACTSYACTWRNVESDERDFCRAHVWNKNSHGQRSEWNRVIQTFEHCAREEETCAIHASNIHESVPQTLAAPRCICLAFGGTLEDDNLYIYARKVWMMHTSDERAKS